MEQAFLLIFGAILTVGAYQDLKTRKVSDYIPITAWIIAYSSRSAFMTDILITFPLTWALAWACEKYKLGKIGWSDVTFIPVFLMFLDELGKSNQIQAAVIFLMTLVFFYPERFRLKKWENHPPGYLYMLLFYLILLIPYFYPW
jgi:Flp pilus assembly protein protease CpaA